MPHETELLYLVLLIMLTLIIDFNSQMDYAEAQSLVTRSLRRIRSARPKFASLQLCRGENALESSNGGERAHLRIPMSGM